MNNIIKKASRVLCFILICIPQFLLYDFLEYDILSFDLILSIEKIFLGLAGIVFLQFFYVILFRVIASDRFKIYFFASQLIWPAFSYIGGLLTIRLMEWFSWIDEPISSYTIILFFVFFLTEVVPVFILRKLYFVSADNRQDICHSLVYAMLLLVILVILLMLS